MTAWHVAGIDMAAETSASCNERRNANMANKTARSSTHKLAPIAHIFAHCAARIFTFIARRKKKKAKYQHVA